MLLNPVLLQVTERNVWNKRTISGILRRNHRTLRTHRRQYVPHLHTRQKRVQHLTDERRPLLIVRSVKNSQKGRRWGREGGNAVVTASKKSPEKQTKTRPFETGHRPGTPPIHLQLAYIFGQLVFSPREIYHVPTPLSRPVPSVRRRVAGNNWQARGVVVFRPGNSPSRERLFGER